MKLKPLLFFLFLSNILFSQTVSKDSLQKLHDELDFQCVNNAGDSLKGIALANAYLLLDPNSAEVYNDRGVAYHRCHNYKQAMSDLAKAISIDKKGYQPFFNMGLAYYELEKYPQAIAYFDTAIVLNPTHVKSYYFKANAYGKAGNLQSALVFFNKALEVDSKYYLAYKDRGITYSELKKYNEAIKDYDMAISLNTADYEIYFVKSLSLIRLSQPDKAIAELSKAQKLSDNSNIDMGFAYAYMAKQNKVKTCEYMKKAVDKKNPDAVDAYKEFCK